MVLIYSLLAKLIGLVFSLVSQILLLIDNLSKYNFFSVKTVNDFTTKVYVIVGVLMLFKLVISAIQYIVNPDNFSDKNKGLGSILTKSVIVVALLALVPTIFDFALDVQNTIVDAIPNVIFGNNTTSTGENFSNIGEQISVSILTGFLTPTSGKTATIPVNKVDDFEKAATEGCDASILTSAWLLGTNCVNDKWWVLALPIGIFLVFTLVAMAADVGIRTIKFGIVQILAPIPIVSYISDEKKFNNWVTTSLQIYADLFVRMGIIYFVIYFIKVVLQDFLTTTGYPQEFASSIGRTPQPMEIVFVKVFIVIALILFAKNAPKFITDLLGIKGADDSIGNMFKRAGGLFGAGLGGLRTARSNYTTQKERYDSKGKRKGRQIAEGLRSAAAGFGSATARGLFMAGQGKGYKDVRQNSFKNAIGARNRRIDRVDNLYSDDYGYSDYKKDVRREKLGIPSGTAFVKTRYDTMEQIAKVAADARGHGSGKMNETPNRYQVSFTKVDSDGNVKFKDDDYKLIHSSLGYDSLSMEQVRNLYTLAKNGQMVEKKDGTKIFLNAKELEALGSIVQTIEKRTSYLKEAEMMGNKDPAAYPNVDKIRMAIENNATMFNSSEIMTPIIEKMKKYGITDSSGNAVTNVAQLKEVVTTLQNFIDIKDTKRFPTEADYYAEVEKRADILTAVKDAFEEVSRQQYAPAQIADARAKKAQQAISNNNDKK